MAPAPHHAFSTWKDDHYFCTKLLPGTTRDVSGCAKVNVFQGGYGEREWNRMARERSFIPSPDHQTPGLAGPGPCLTGEIDGNLGENTRKAIEVFRELKGLGPKTLVDQQLWGVLTRETLSRFWSPTRSARRMLPDLS